eukprot:SAG11_NODE_37767_length_255_cov_0.948718_1_plen_51_part_01
MLMLIALGLPALTSAASSVELLLKLPGGCEMKKLPPKASAHEDEQRGCFND